MRAIAVLLLLIIGVPGATSGSPLGLDAFGGSHPPVAAPPVDDIYYFGAVADRDVVLSRAQLARAATGYRHLVAPQQVRMDALLAIVPLRARGYLLKAFAAGHPLDELAEFAGVIASRDRDWLRTHLSLIDPVEPGPVDYRGFLVHQYDDTSCGSTSVVVARAIIDPIYTYYLTTGGHPDTPEESGPRFLERLKAEERRGGQGSEPPAGGRGRGPPPVGGGGGEQTAVRLSAAGHG